MRLDESTKLISAIKVSLDLLPGSLLIFKHYKEEADIASMTWKIDMEEVREVKQGGGDRTEFCNNKRRHSGGSLVSRVSKDTMFGEMRQKYITTAQYKGTVVALKTISAKNISMNRNLLIELKRMKDLQHDHLVRYEPRLLYNC